ncbi:NAD(P)/FAD-dependent oxidoreductase [Candidatus Amarolinea dominans]|uniref:NAD(P)/FAD-dependent oxidoreductase n=1 Tax=Candidatus Amarolinea dominans TaxID=3140696 RepID=UPI0031346E66|nr:NAD(P)/FAD-dependent oxidoreductase [Anaerolineae bacterium]
MNSQTKVAIIGGGAAGVMAAITCAEANPQAQVTILEKATQPLGKVRISGGGRCNVTHACFDPAQLVTFYPRGGKALRGPFTRFQPRDTIAWFAARGVPLKTEADGRVFPVTDSSATIVACLLHAAHAAGVTLRTQAQVTRVSRPADGFQIDLATGETLAADDVLLATGAEHRAYAWAQELGHTIQPPAPSLFTFTVRDARLTGLAGVSAPLVHLRLVDSGLAQSGPLLITHWGLSGPAVLKLSAWGARVLHDQHYQAQLRINWLPAWTRLDAHDHLHAVRVAQARRAPGSQALFDLPLRLWQRLILAAGVSEGQRWGDLTKLQLQRLLDELTAGAYAIEGKGAFKEEFVTCGGVTLDEVNFKTMQSRCCPGLYLAGEILDVDGVTGGFNFQSAWTTGWLAGNALSRRR